MCVGTPTGAVVEEVAGAAAVPPGDGGRRTGRTSR